MRNITFLIYDENTKLILLILHQLRLRDYLFDNQNKAPIGPDDILNIFPVVKHINMPTADASKVYSAAQSFIHKGTVGQENCSLSYGLILRCIVM